MQRDKKGITIPKEWFKATLSIQRMLMQQVRFLHPGARITCNLYL